MNLRKSRILVFAVLFLACLLPAGSLAQVDPASSAPPADSRVEPEVLAQLTARGTAGYLIYLDDRPDLSPAYRMNWIDRGRFVVKTLQETAARSQAEVRAYLDAQGVPYEAFWIENVIAVDSSGRTTLDGVLGFPKVEAVRARRHPILYEPVESGLTEIVPAAVQPNLTHVGADQVWAMGYTGQGAVVANIDTGVRYTHEALFSHYRGRDGDNNYNWWDPYGTYPTAPADDYGHGTHTMGIMVGEDASQAHQIGMAPGAQWMACRGCTLTSCTDAALLECAEFVTAPWNLSKRNPNPDLRPQIVNNSWGSCDTAYDGWYQGVVDGWQAAGIYPVFSNGNAGNTGCPAVAACNTVGNPARYGNVTGVGSTGQSNGLLAAHSLWGPTDNPDTVNPNGYPSLKPQVLAPGVAIYSSVKTSDTAYESWAGTSMSAPAVSGLVALMWSACPSLAGDYANTETIIQDTATRIPYASNCGGEGPGNVPNMATGWGEINALAAVQAAIDRCGGLGYLQGTVTGGTPPAAVENAVVTATRQEGGFWQKRTDASGYYTLTVPYGTFTVTAAHSLYSTAEAAGVGVVTGTTTTQDFHLVPKGWLHGVVLDADSAVPLQATVSTSSGASATTDPVTGYYEMALDAGTYQVTAEATNYASQTLTIDVTPAVSVVHDFLLRAAIAVVPEPIAAAVELGQVGSASAVMTNNMTVAYPFQFVEINTALARSERVLDSAADPFGYTYSDSAQPGGPQYSWIDATDGTALDLADDAAINVTLPFAFDFYGTTSSALRVGNNGAVLFGSIFGEILAANQDLSTSSTDNLIAPFWDDIDSSAGRVYYKTVGTAPSRRFVVEWYNRPHYSNVGRVTFELILYEGSHNIKFQYQDVVFDNAAYDYGASATVGIRQAGLNYLQVAFNAPVLADSMAICFRYPGALPCDAGDVPWVGISIEGATLAAGDSLVWTTYFTATAAAGIVEPGEYHAQLLAIPAGAGDSGLPTKEIPIVLTVLPAPTMGKLEGLVTSDRPGGPLTAQLLIEGSGEPVTTTSDALGFYMRWLPVGSYTVTTSAGGYLPVSATVEIDSLATTTRNFELVLDAPDLALSPLAFDVRMAPDSVYTESLSVANHGLRDLNWELRETAFAAVTDWVTAVPAEAPEPRSKSANGVVGRPGGPVHPFVPQDVLVDDGFEAGAMPPPGWSLDSTDMSYTWQLQTASPHSGIYAADIEYDPALYFQDEVLLSPEIIPKTGVLSFWSYGSLYWCRDYLDNCDLNVWIVVGEWDGGAGDDIYIGRADGDWPADYTWANTTFDLTPLLPGGPVRIGFQYQGIDGAECALDDILLAGDVGYLWEDVPWVSQVPTHGVTLPGGVYDAAVVFDSTGLGAGGCYTASLGLIHDDPVREVPLLVPLHLCVTEAWQYVYLPVILRGAVP